MIGLVLLLSIPVNFFIEFKWQVYAHQQPSSLYILNKTQWWENKTDALPSYNYNRWGQIIGLFNLQYLGDLPDLTTALEAKGWKKQSNSFGYSLLLYMGSKKSTAIYPLTTPVYLNHKPDLIMVLASEKNHPTLVLRLWHSNYYLHGDKKMLYLGSITPEQPLTAYPIELFNLPGFDIKKLTFPKESGTNNALPHNPCFIKNKTKLNRMFGIFQNNN